MLIQFTHGLGDAVQLSSVLLHMRRSRPHWEVDVAALPGKHSALRGLCRANLILGSEDSTAYDRVFRLEWGECEMAYRGWPSTKVERCLLDVFGIAPDAELCHYELKVGPEADARAAEYLGTIAAPLGDGRFKAVLLHYQGNTAQD
ncbi:MAG TPA: hypothetical protein VFC78_08085 [Tepidisphaeraceae bacterium]|nr:hypothetical protein [Tepidisphaeraceae bacterium]